MGGVINCESNVKVPNIIDAFPEELLLKIFGFLDSTSIRNMTLVNKRCYDIVTNDFSTMKKLELVIRGGKLKKNHFTIGNWKFQKVWFMKIRNSFNTKKLSKLNEIGSNIREIEFYFCYFNKPKVFQNILKNFPKAEKITFKRCFVSKHFKKLDTKVLELENLKELVLDYSGLMILSCIGAQLRILSVNMSRMWSCTEEEKFIDEQHLMKFIYTQKDSVELLALGCKVSNDAYELILKNIENVKTLSIYILDFPADLSFYKRIKVNKNLTNLILNGMIVDPVHYCTILSLFPNVTDISFTNEIHFKMLSCLPKYFNSLTSLSLYSLCPGKYQNLKFPALKNFHLEFIEVGNGWTDLVMSNQTIESISFKFIYKYSNFDPYEIQMVYDVLPNLKHLKLGDDMKEKMYHFQNSKKSIQISYYTWT